MGTIAFLWHRTLGWRRNLRPGRLGPLAVFVVAYATIGLDATSIAFDQGTPIVPVAQRVTIDLAGLSTTAPPSLSTAGRAPVLTNGVPGLARNGAHRTVPSSDDKRGSPRPQETPKPSDERPPLRADPPPAEPLAISGVAISVSASASRRSAPCRR